MHALIANTNRGGEKRLRKLEQRLLDVGVTVARTADELARYHGKILITDKKVFVLGFNYTRLDIERSRSFGVVAEDARLVKAAVELYESDATRQPYSAAEKALVVSPENARDVLSSFIEGAKRSLCIYEMNLSDKRMLKLLQERRKAGVDIRVIGKIAGPPDGVGVRKLKQRLHARAIVRDGNRAFVGSQSLRRSELDKRREVGVLVTDPRVAEDSEGLRRRLGECQAQAGARSAGADQTTAEPRAGGLAGP